MDLWRLALGWLARSKRAKGDLMCARVPETQKNFSKGSLKILPAEMPPNAYIQHYQLFCRMFTTLMEMAIIKPLLLEQRSRFVLRNHLSVPYAVTPALTL